MRPILLLLVGCVLTAQAQNTATPAQQAEQHYTRGLAAEKAGDPATARASYQAALRLNPRHANAQYRLGELKSSGAGIAAKGREAKFGQVTIPQFAVEDATLSEALEVLRISLEKASPEGTAAPNFIVKDPDNRLAAARITFQLKGVPAKAIFDYILSQASAKASYEEYAVVVEPSAR